MSEPTAKRKRASRRVVRAWAWTMGALSFLGPWGLFSLWPKPVSSVAAPSAATSQRPVVVVVTKKIVYTKSPTPSVSSTPQVRYVSAPSAPAAAVSCGSPPC